MKVFIMQRYKYSLIKQEKGLLFYNEKRAPANCVLGIIRLQCR